MFDELADDGVLVLAAVEGLEDVDGLDAAAAELSAAEPPIAPDGLLDAPAEVQ
ncbi:MAG TPA: hypothetical protein VKU60_09300 [Chloroflexota bacterium]|nr:hypothetical protein [Chloroflexota bacterium]